MDSGDGIEPLLDVGLDRRIRGGAKGEISLGDSRWPRRQVVVAALFAESARVSRALAALRPRIDGVRSRGPTFGPGEGPYLDDGAQVRL